MRRILAAGPNNMRIEAFRDDDRRLLARVTPPQALAGRIGHVSIRIIDISLHGLRIAHHEALNVGALSPVSFHWGEQTIEASCEVVRSRLFSSSRDGLEFHSGLRIVEPASGSASLLRQLVCWHVTRALERNRADAHGEPQPHADPDPDPNPQPATRLYLRCVLIRGAWRRIVTTDPDQPSLGFTVAANESPLNVDRLSDCYLLADRETRQMIRKMAAASLT